MPDSNRRLVYNSLGGHSFKKSVVVFYFIWPLAGLYFSLRNFKNEWSKNIFWFFCIFFGYSFIIGQTDSTDSFYYANIFLRYTYSNLSFRELLDSFYSESSSFVDIASPLISYLIAQITKDPRILFATFGLIFGFFYSRNLWLILDHIKGRISTVILLFVATFALINPIWNINGFRMWTAAQIFLYGILPYFLNGDKKKLPWSFVSILFHFSFMAPVAILFLFLFLKNRLNMYMGFFILTSFIKEIDPDLVRSALSLLPGLFQTRLSGYTNIEYAETLREMGQSIKWFVKLSGESLQWISYLFAIYIFLFGRNLLKSNKELLTLFCFTLFLFGFANIASQLPSGGRFIVIANTFMYSFIIIFISNFREVKWLPFVKTVSIPFLLLYISVSIREGMDFFGLTTVIGNPFIVAMYPDPVPFITGIKNLLP